MKNADHHTDSIFMRRAYELAIKGSGYVSPNPLVGCVIVHNGQVIGEGWHQKYGEAHAEVNAVNNVTDKTHLSQSTVYVNLEPCAHFGKTPPCADLLIQHQVKKVIIANVDSNHLVAGEGIKRMRASGIEVVTGVLEQQGRDLNKRFFTYIEKQRPYIILKWAETADGYIARKNYDSKWISNEYSRQLVHRWRTEEDAVLTGTGTVAHDNPKLNVRDWTGRNPIRIILDRFLKLNKTLHVFDGTQKTICYNILQDEVNDNFSLIRVSENNFINNVVSDLFKLKIQSFIVEGGTQTLNLFIESGLWDEARIFTADKIFNDGIVAPQIKGELVYEEKVMADKLKCLINNR